MKMEIDGSMRFELAEYCAGVIHSHIVQMHLRRSWGLRGDEAGKPNPYGLSAWQRENMSGVQAAVRSIDDMWDRRMFVRTIKQCLGRKMEAGGTDRNWMDYVKKVASVNDVTSQAGRAVPCTPPIANERTLLHHGGAHGVIALPTV